MNEATKETLKRIPSMDRLLSSEPSQELLGNYYPSLVKDILREILDETREQILDEKIGGDAVASDDKAYLERARERIEKLLSGSLGRLVNATGVIVHTNLGRAPMGKEVVEHMARIAEGYSNLEYDLARGARGHRETHVEAMMVRLLGCERCCVVNNNAGAVLLVLNTLAEGRETIVSRGELIEIGGSFRIPDIMKKSGSRLVEVGTTNKTRISDYERAITEQTGMILKVHPSNYRIVGFTESVGLQELVKLGGERGIPVVEDQGSGNLVPLEECGIQGEQAAPSILSAGAHMVLFSGDKVLGGPQAGVIAGRKELVSRCLRNPLYRVLRPDKTTLAGLEATLRLYLGGRPFEEIPVLRMITMTKKEITARAKELISALEPTKRFKLSLVDGNSRVGGGAVPLQELPSKLISVKPFHASCSVFESFLRSFQPPVIARIEEEQVLLDLRTVLDGEISFVTAALKAYEGSQ